MPIFSVAMVTFVYMVITFAMIISVTVVIFVTMVVSYLSPFPWLSACFSTTRTSNTHCHVVCTHKQSFIIMAVLETVLTS